MVSNTYLHNNITNCTYNTKLEKEAHEWYNVVELPVNDYKYNLLCTEIDYVIICVIANKYVLIKKHFCFLYLANYFANGMQGLLNREN